MPIRRDPGRECLHPDTRFFQGGKKKEIRRILGRMSGAWATLLLLLLSTPAAAQPLTQTEREAIDKAAQAALDATGAPSASISVVRGGQIVYDHAYGADGRITPRTPPCRPCVSASGRSASSSRRPPSSCSKRSGSCRSTTRWRSGIPQLTRAGYISVRQLLSMTAGYQDYWLQDYVFPDMLNPVTPPAIMQRWAGKALDFDPGTKWQYSNTNYVIAAAIVERVAGTSFMDFLRQRIFTLLKMTSAADLNTNALKPTDAQPPLRHALGPLRAAPKEAPGWLFGAGQLAMTAHDLSLWNIAVMNRAVLRPSSHTTQQTEVRPRRAPPLVWPRRHHQRGRGGRRRIAHGGAVSGYTSTSVIYPTMSASIVVFTNIYPGVPGGRQIGSRRRSPMFILLRRCHGRQRLARRRPPILIGPTKGIIDRALFTPAANAYFTQEVLADYGRSLTPLGLPNELRRLANHCEAG